MRDGTTRRRARSVLRRCRRVLVRLAVLTAVAAVVLVLAAVKVFGVDFVDRIHELVAPSVRFEPDIAGDPMIGGHVAPPGESGFTLTVTPTVDRVTLVTMCRSDAPEAQLSFALVTGGREPIVRLGRCRPGQASPAITWGGYDGLPAGRPSTLHVQFTGPGMTPVHDPDVRLALAVYAESGPRHRPGSLEFDKHLRAFGAEYRLAGTAEHPFPDDDFPENDFPENDGGESIFSLDVPAQAAPAVVVVRSEGDADMFGPMNQLELYVDGEPQGIRREAGYHWGPTLLPDARAHEVEVFAAGAGTGRLAIAYYVPVP